MKNRFEQLKPAIKGYAITSHFKRDVGSIEKATAIVIEVLESKESEQMHKFEELIEENLIFRAKIQGVHIVYVLTPSQRLVFLRAFKNFKSYEHFLADKQALLSAIEYAKL